MHGVQINAKQTKFSMACKEIKMKKNLYVIYLRLSNKSLNQIFKVLAIRDNDATHVHNSYYFCNSLSDFI